MNQVPIDRGYLETLSRRIRELEARIQKLENANTPCVPIYDKTNFPTDAIEGQVAIAQV